MDRLLSSQEVADRLSVDTKTVVRYVRAGKLVGSRIGREYRITESSVAALLRRTNPTTPAERTALVTAVVSQKGGVAKTTTAFNLGAGLHKLARRVLLVDFDPQASLSISAGGPVAQLTASVYQALLDDSLDPASLIRSTVSGADILPATLDLAAAELELVNVISRELVLRDVINKLRSRYDHIIIDCPPSLGLLTINALAAADQIIIPLECEFLATRGLALLMNTLTKVRSRLNRDLRLAWIVPTKYDSRTIHAKEILDEVRASFPGQVFDEPIKLSVRIKEAPAAGLSIFDYDPNHDAARAYLKLAQEVDRG